ncbi:MAG TPA: hypothetical protein VHV77_08530 [Pirellulales bacterium]|jgi:UDP-2,3-diacylglucosamine pyrophosphatase LpxH|nr:hypothetical protein [Pirellulales bacterium]
MLVIVSDLHLTDGTAGPSVSPQAFELFASQLRSLAENASWRADGRYRPVERIDVLLLGDTLDFMRSTTWTQRSDVRPWDVAHRPALIEIVGRITADILQHNERSLEILRSLAEDGAITIPPADLRGRPVVDTPATPVPLYIHYLVGEHDWFLHVDAKAYDDVRGLVVRHLGLAQRADEPFAHDASENEALLELLRRHRLMARHGDVFDPLSYNGQRDASSLSDAIAIELLTPFTSQIVLELKEHLPAATAIGIGDLHHVRPLALVPAWIESLLERTCPQAELRRRIKVVWNRMVERLFELPVAEQCQAWHGSELIARLRQVMRIGAAGSGISWNDESLEHMGQIASYARHAMGEPDFRNRRAKAIVYGHTHQSETMPLDASFADGYVLNQMYFNAGTWRRVMRPTAISPSLREFIAWESMGCAAFFQGDERSGRPYETWNGTLGAKPIAAATLRVDDTSSAEAPVPQHAPAGSHLGTSHVVPPHFATAPSRVIPVRRPT